MVAIPKNGSLQETPLPDLLLDLFRARFDGSLRLSRERLEKTFLFQKGIPIFAESNLASETLGVQLMDSGRISRDDYTRVSDRMKKEKCKEGVALLELEILDPKTLFVALKEQVRVRVVDCFGWPDGAFAVEPSEAPPDAAQPFRADVYSLTQEGIETHWSADRVLTALSEHMNDSVSRTSLLSRIQDRLLWDDAVQEFVDALDGTQTLWRALQLARSPRALAAAWVLDAVGALQYGDANQPANADAGAVPEIEIVLRDKTAGISASASISSRTGGTGASVVEMDPELIIEITEKFATLTDSDHYAVLGVERNASTADIRRAYLDAAKRYHPDTIARTDAGAQVREEVGLIFAAIGKAYSLLANPTRRRDYDISIDSDAQDVDVERLAAAEKNFRKAEILMRVGNFRGALEYLEPAVELWPEEAAYQAALGWSLFKKLPSEPERARAHLEAAYQINAEDAETVSRLALVLKALGDGDAADALQDKARQLDSDAR